MVWAEVAGVLLEMECSLQALGLIHFHLFTVSTYTVSYFIRSELFSWKSVVQNCWRIINFVMRIVTEWVRIVRLGYVLA